MKYSFLFLTLTLLSSCKLADLRTDTFKQEGITSSNELKGKQILKESWKAQGMDKLQQFQTYEVVGKDHWKGLTGKTANPWPANNALTQLRYAIGTFDGQMEILEGKKKGWSAGLQSWQYYEFSKGQTPSFDVKKDKAISFIIPAYQYFFELIGRLKNAPIVAYMGQRQFNGQDYDLVFTSWESDAPNEKNDQYVLYVNTKTKLIDYASYTLRDNYLPAPKGLYGTIHFKDFRDIEGIKIPFQQTVFTKDPKTKEEKYLHKLTVNDFRFDSFDKSLLYPNPNLGTLGDQKLE